MRMWINLVAAAVVLGMSLPAHAQYPTTTTSTQAVGVGPAQQFAGVGTNVGNSNFLYPNATSNSIGGGRMNLASTGLFDRIVNMSFFNTAYNGYNSGATQYPDMGLSYLQSFGYRVAQPAK
jgi:hypothetical protein